MFSFLSFEKYIRIGSNVWANNYIEIYISNNFDHISKSKMIVANIHDHKLVKYINSNPFSNCNNLVLCNSWFTTYHSHHHTSILDCINLQLTKKLKSFYKTCEIIQSFLQCRFVNIPIVLKFFQSQFGTWDSQEFVASQKICLEILFHGITIRQRAIHNPQASHGGGGIKKVHSLVSLVNNFAWGHHPKDIIIMINHSWFSKHINGKILELENSQ
jgi:hypothetical protein